VEDLILVFFPGEEIRSKSDKKKNCQQQTYGPGDLVGAFVPDDLFTVTRESFSGFSSEGSDAWLFFDFSRFAMIAKISE